MLQNNNGAVAIWMMDGSGHMSQSDLVANPGPNWHVEGTGDFNQDGKTDILLQNNNGAVAVWEMNGSGQIGQSAPQISQSALLANPGPNWHVEGTGDFNQDGKTDILLQNNNGAVAIWEMDGSGHIMQSAAVANPGRNWHIEATGDFNLDGKTDIALQNNNGAVAVWDMNGTTIMGSGLIANPVRRGASLVMGATRVSS